MKTHKVLDLLYHGEEGQIVFSGSKKECKTFKQENGPIAMLIIPLSRIEIKYHNPKNSAITKNFFQFLHNI